ncbi:hypothetical protein ASC63_06065 [Leifsonia sp. Root112D2]|jgi:hypothetical protein|nr:hypothetical protein ASC63_06065 [Leifsonia sp. Root112D2]
MRDNGGMQNNETVTPDTVTVRRAPRYGRFMIVGVVVFAIVAFILTYSFPQQQNAGYGRLQVFGFMLLVAIVVGVAVGGVVALLVDRAATRRARTVIVDRVDAHEVVGESVESDATSGA